MKSRILLIGKNGQVGHDLQQVLPACGELAAVDREQLDLSAPEAIRRAVQEIRPQLIINAAAYTAVDQAERNEPAAHAINAVAPGILAEQAKKIGAALIHYSTDYVFDGTKTTPYEESDPTNPVGAYGRTKLAGEQAIRDSGVAYLIFRTAWVYSRRGKNFLLTILRLSTQREELRIVKDQIGAPTSSRELAEATATVISQLSATEGGSAKEILAAASGIYHMTAGGATDWSEFAAEILDHASAATEARKPGWLVTALHGAPLIARRVVPITTSEYPTLARRPPYSVLSNERLAKTFGIRLADWKTQLRRVFEVSPETDPLSRSR
jgi:dTDP-4-dehydrorhamnose reductase